MIQSSNSRTGASSLLNFTPLTPEHFPLLLQWLAAPHVHTWWDQEIHWTAEAVAAKYLPRTMPDSSVRCYIILLGDTPIGYIQYYNYYTIPEHEQLAGLPTSLAAFDLFIGEEKYTGRGIGSAALRLFLETYSDQQYEYAFAQPERKNRAAVRAYEKAGFTWHGNYMLRRR